MAIHCNFGQPDCTAFPTKTRPTASPLAVVIHLLADDFTTVMNNQIIQTVQTVNYNTAVGYHYLVSNTGIAIKLVNPLEQVPNLHNYNEPAWEGVPESGAGSTDPDEIVVHVALTNISLPCNTLTQAQQRELVRVLCCVVAAFNSTLEADDSHIFLPDVLDISQADYYDGSSLPESLFSQTGECLNGNVPSLFTALDEENCCTENSEAIEALQETVETLQGNVSDLVTNLATAIARIGELEEWQESAAPIIETVGTKYDALSGELQSIRIFLASIKACLDEVCPAVDNCGVIEYSLSQVGDAQVVIPVYDRHINFPDKISDRNPAIVKTGPLWSADLPAGTFGVVVTARLASSSYANGNKVWLTLVECGIKTKIAELTLSGGAQTVELDSSNEAQMTEDWEESDQRILITTPCPDFHIEIGTDAASGKVLENASITITPIL